MTPPQPRRPHKGGKPTPAPDGGAAARTSIRAWILAHEDDSDDLSALAARIRRLPAGTLPPGWAPAIVRAIGARPSCVARLGELARGERLPPAAVELAPVFQGAA